MNDVAHIISAIRQADAAAADEPSLLAYGVLHLDTVHLGDQGQ